MQDAFDLALPRVEAALTAALNEAVAVPHDERIGFIGHHLLAQADSTPTPQLPQGSISQQLDEEEKARLEAAMAEAVSGALTRPGSARRNIGTLMLAAAGASSAPPQAQAQRDAANPTELLLLDQLLADSATAVDKPVLAHAARLASGRRGLSIKMLRAVWAFYDSRELLDTPMVNVCKGPLAEPVSMLQMTASTGLSLAESLALVAEREGRSVDGLLGAATTFFSYSWEGQTLRDVLSGIFDTDASLRGDGEEKAERYVWVDMFCASQNLLANTYKKEAFERGSAEYTARKEDTDALFDGALDATSELFFLASPLTGEWAAPAHPFLDPAQGEPPASGWMRTGPRAGTRCAAAAATRTHAHACSAL